MCACCKFLDNLLMAAMDPVKDANSQPGILQIHFLKGMVMLHIYKCSQRHPWRWSDIGHFVCFEQLLLPRTAREI
jgi:hypothetical protein